MVGSGDGAGSLSVSDVLLIWITVGARACCTCSGCRFWGCLNFPLSSIMSYGYLSFIRYSFLILVLILLNDLMNFKLTMTCITVKVLKEINSKMLLIKISRYTFYFKSVSKILIA